MKIALVVDDYHGGAGNVAQLLAIELNNAYDVSLILTNKHSVPRYNLEGVSVYEENFSIQTKNKVKGLISGVKRMRKLIASIGADLIISFLDNNNSLVCLSQWKSKIPVIVSERSNPLVIFPKFPWDIIRRIAYRRADVVTVQFDSFKAFDKARFAKKCKVTANIVEKPSSLKNTWESERIRFATFARLADIKRIDLMIRLFAQAQKEVNNAELHIYGDGPNRERLQNLIEELGLSEHVFLEGYCNEVHKTLVNHDVYLMTSQQEGFPNSLCEAMAVGLPSVAFCCHDGIEELMENNRRGFAVREGDEQDFVEKMILLSRDKELRKSMGLCAQNIAEVYCKERIMEQWNLCIEAGCNR